MVVPPCDHPHHVPLIVLLHSLLSLGFRLRQVLFDSQPYDSADQSQWNRLIQRKPKIAFLTDVGGDGLLNGLVPRDGWVEPDVLSERSEVNQYPMKSKGGHSVANDLFGIRRSCPDRGPDVLEDRLDIGR